MSADEMVFLGRVTLILSFLVYIFLSATRLSSRLPNVKITLAPIAGFYFFAYPYTGPNHTASYLVDFREQAWPTTIALWGSYIDPKCAAGLGPARAHACMLSAYSFPFISAPSFAIEAQTDIVQLEAHNSLPNGNHASRVNSPQESAYERAWSANMTRALAPLLDVRVPDTGAFNPACFIHGDFTADAPRIGGVDFITAFSRFYHRGGQHAAAPQDYKLADSCGIECNPTCVSP